MEEGQKGNYLNVGRTEGQLFKYRKDRRAIITVYEGQKDYY